MAQALVLVQTLAWLVAACFAQSSFKQLIDGLNHAASISDAGGPFHEEEQKFKNDEMPDMTPEQMATYDFIVVGAGSAGSVVASRLSENSNWTVLLIEAGGPEEFVMDIPFLAEANQMRDINWNYITEPSNEYCLGMTNKQCSWPRGKVMGGTDIFSCMIAIRGYKSVYNKWAEMGNTGWSYEELLPYFKKLEDMKFEELRKDENMHGNNGPMKISPLPYRTKFAENLMGAARELGYRTNYDYNGETQIGFSFLQTINVDGRRWSTNRAYLHPNSKRSNLYNTKYSLVKRVLFDQKTKRAYGVEFIKGSKTYEVHASKEVILCAGSIGSPQLLMLSGVGPKDHLSEIGIPVIQNAAVGRNLIDHPGYFGLVIMVNQTLTVPFLDMINPKKPYFKDYVEKKGASPLSLPYNSEVIGFINVDEPFKTDGEPNVALLEMCGSIAFNYIFGINYRETNATFNEMFASVKDITSWTIASFLLSPKSRGVIELRDKHIHSHPKITPNYYSHPEDVRLSIAGIRKAIELSQANALKKYGTQVHIAQVPGCENKEYDSDAYWECALRVLTITLSHQAGTCKMGPEEDSTAVVNPQLQVIGVENLRVADASIMPTLPTGRPNIPTIMIAEKLSDMVKKRWGYST